VVIRLASNVLVWLAKKAFFGHVPFTVVNIDAEKKTPFRDHRVAGRSP
jgi:sulfate adenylyltransferase subunit 2